MKGLIRLVKTFLTVQIRFLFVLQQIEQCKTEDDELDHVAMASIFSEKVRY